MLHRDASVTIVGAGPVGLVLAIDLTHHGVDVLVLERESALCPESRAPGVLPSTLELMRHWQLLPQFEAEGMKLDHARLYSALDDRPFFDVALEPVLAAETAVPFLTILPQDKTVRILAQRAFSSHLATLRLGHCVLSAKQIGKNVVTRVKDPKGAIHEVRSPYLVACDGARSVVRHGLGLALEGKTYPTRMTLADVRIAPGKTSAALPWPRALREDNGSFSAAIRLDAKTWRLISSMGPHETDEQALAPKVLAQRAKRLLRSQDYEVIWARNFRIHCRASPQFRRGHILLAGDAAHINSPAGGQGMNSGILDAHNLAWKLAACLRGGDCERLLTSYEQERRQAIVDRVERYTDLLTRMVLQGGPMRIRIFGSLLRLLMRVPSLRRRAIRRAAMLDTHYKKSACLFSRRKWSGEPAPEGRLWRKDGSEIFLRDLVDPNSLLVIFCDAPAFLRYFASGALAPGVQRVAVCRRAATLTADFTPSPSLFWDREGLVWKAWKAHEGFAALVRPDGIVAWSAMWPSFRDMTAAIALALGGQAKEQNRYRFEFVPQEVF